ncbi:MAG: TetR/AcrR family transcriptional regulator [Bacillota bacterium]|nr:TetR/AcrR family transcriptional regulator [Bacillota bacterium]
MDTLSRKERERLTRENEIIKAAQKVFCDHGYNDASMDEIARNAQFTKRTLYQYFANKEELYFSVVIKGYEQLYTKISEALKKDDNGFMKIYHSCIAYYDFYTSHPEVIRLMNYAGYAKKDASGDSPRREKLSNLDNEVFKAIAKVIEEGKGDGSIKPDLDANMAAYSLVYTVTGFFNQLSISGKTFTGHFNIEFDKFVPYSLNLLLNSIRNEREAQL